MPESCNELDEAVVVFNRVAKQPFPEASCTERADGNKLVLTPSIRRTSSEEGRWTRINLRKFARARARPGFTEGLTELGGDTAA